MSSFTCFLKETKQFGNVVCCKFELVNNNYFCLPACLQKLQEAAANLARSSTVMYRVGVIKIVIVINCNLITFYEVIACNCN